MKQERNI